MAYSIAKDAVVGYGSSAVNTVIGLEEAFIYRPLAAAADLVGWQDAGNYIRSNVSQAKSTVNTAMESMVTDMQIYQTAKAGMDTAQLVYGVGSLAKSAYQAAMSYEKVANVVAKVEAKANAAIQKVSQNVMKAANKVMDDIAAAGNKLLTNQGGYIKFPGKAQQIESSVAKGTVKADTAGGLGAMKNPSYAVPEANGAFKARTELPPDATVIRGGLSSTENLKANQLNDPNLTISARGGMGVSEVTMAEGFKNGQITVTSVAELNARGYKVVSSPSAGNPYHVDIITPNGVKLTDAEAANLSGAFKAVPNPAKK